MSDKLQEIKDNLMQREHYADYAVNLITAEKKQREDLKWLIEQLEQAQEEVTNYKQRYETLVQAIRTGYMFSESANGLIYQIESTTDFKLWEDER